MAKSKSIKTFSIMGREITIHKRKTFFGNSELSVKEGKKTHTKLSYRVKDDVGTIKASGFRYKVRLSPSLRGEGIHSFMLDHALDDMKQNGAEKILISLAPDLGSEKQLFTQFSKRGFKKISDDLVLVGDPIDAPGVIDSPQKISETWMWKKDE